jgi:hypothetical protein
MHLGSSYGRTTMAAALVMLGSWLLAADPPGLSNRVAIQKLSFLGGKWRGEAAIQMGPDRKIVLQHSEDVAFRVGGTTLVIEGIGRGVPPGSDQETVLFNAMAVVSWSEKDGYAMRAYTGEGKTIEPKIVVQDGGFEWSFQDAERNVSIRYAMKLTADGKWQEHGEMSRDGGATWSGFFDMLLTRAEKP